MKPRLEQAERERVEASVAVAERRTSAEFRVGVVGRSSVYGEWRTFGAVALTFIVTFGAAVALPELPPSRILLLQPLAAALFWALCGIPRVLLFLVPDHRERAAVEMRAKAMFVDTGMSKTSRHTGVLVLLSVLERRVHILVDEGVARVLPPTELPPYVDIVVRAAREGRAVDGICQALEALSTRLSAPLPPGPKPLDELPDTVAEG
jgi:putative membrane protein